VEQLPSIENTAFGARSGEAQHSRDDVYFGAVAIPIACGASKKADIIRRLLPQPPA
jgi:hypothetical protein